MGPRLHVLLVEPYFTGSHRAWAEGFAAHSRHRVDVVSHTGGFWKWRMHGAALTLARAIEEAVARRGMPDVLLVSDMVHVPALLGFLRRSVPLPPVVVFMHENQLGYPLPEGASPDLTYAMTNWLGLAVADRVVFNSEFHRTDLLERLPGFLNQFPDHRHTGEVAAVEEKSVVLPVGVDGPRFSGGRRGNARPVVLWNHRWEYDKDPDLFFAVMSSLADDAVEFDVAVAGMRYQTVPPVFEAARRRLGDRVVHFGTATTEQYPQLLRSADVVVSTARHEFFGVAVVEAVAAGALPILPDRLSYPELVPAPWPYLYTDAADLEARLRWALTDPDGRDRHRAAASEHVRRFWWERVAPRYDMLLEEVAAN